MLRKIIMHYIGKIFFPDITYNKVLDGYIERAKAKQNRKKDENRNF